MRGKCKATTLCFKCGRLDCSWMSDARAVPGWEAEKHITTDRHGTKHVSYLVINCPCYRKATKADNVVKSFTGARDLLDVIKNQAIKDYVTSKLWLNGHPYDADARRSVNEARSFLLHGYGSPEENKPLVEKLDRLIGTATTMRELRRKGAPKI